VSQHLSRADAEALARIAEALSSPARVQLAVMLVNGAARPVDLRVWLRQSGTTLSQPAVSHHLKWLVDAGLAGKRSTTWEASYWLTEQGRLVVASMLGGGR